MKKNRNNNACRLLIGICFLAWFSSCKKDDGDRQPFDNDTTKPGVVSNMKVINFNGGAYITYTLPSTQNVLYVEANYNINSVRTRQGQASYYIDTIKVEGFAESRDYEVTLYSVSRANIKSDPVTVTVHPDKPYYKLIKESVVLKPDFGGVNITARNSARRNVSITFLARDAATNKFAIVDQHFESVDSINYSLRGYAAKPQEFGYYVSDEFGNNSDTSFVTITPLFEVLLDKKKFYTYRLPSDSQVGYGWEVLYLWDNKTDGNSPGWHTTGGSVPMMCTFGLGQSAQLSHFILWERPNGSVYGYGEPKSFTLWGSNSNAPGDATIPLYGPQGTVVGDWTSLGTFRFPDPPSGLLPGQTNAADEVFVEAGVNFNVSINNPTVKFIRFAANDTWGGVDYTHIMELSFYGN